MNRLLRWCLWAYPRRLRERDGDYLVDLSEELAGTGGRGRQALSLVRGGLAERTRAPGVRLGSALTTLLAVGLLVATPTLRSEVEVELSASAAPAPAAAHPGAGRDGGAGRLREVVAAVVPRGASGAVVAVRDGRTSCVGFGTADRARGVPAGCDTVFDIGSVTKQFTAAAVLHLRSRGRLRVGDPIGRWFPDAPPDKAGITVHQLLTHTSGLPASLGDDYARLTRRDLREEAFAARLRSRPGTAHRYSNVGYSLLALVVEEASGATYEEYLARHLFRPAGMGSTGYVLPDWSRRSVAVEYDADGTPQGRPMDHPWASGGPWWNLRGNGGMLSTARDLARWHRALEDGRVLPLRAVRALTRPRVPEDASGRSWYGYGWVVLDSPVGRVGWHNGGNGWSYAEVARVPGRDAMTFWVTNRVRSRGHWDLARLDLTSVLLRHLFRSGVRAG